MGGRTRRRFLESLGVAANGLLAGCLGGTAPGASTPPSPSETDSAPPTPPSFPTLTPENLLPRAGDGWTRGRVDTGGFAWSLRGGERGVSGYYTSPDGRAYRVVVMETTETYSPEQEAHSWKCSAGWSVALTYGRFAIAAGTGTTRQEFTPEQPPHMTRTPVPGTADAAEELLSRSPRLSREYVGNNAITDADC